MAMKKVTGKLDIIAYLASLKSPIRELMFEVRSIVLETDEEISEAIKWGSIVFNCKGNFAGFRVAKNHLTVVFFNGVALRDKYKLLEKGAGVKARNIKFTDIEKIKKKGLQDLIRQAVALNRKK